MSKTPTPKLEKKIDALAAAVANGFAEMDQRFEKIDKRFEQVDERFNAIDKRFDRVEGRLDRLEFLATGQDRQVEILEDKVRQIATKVGLKFN